MQEVLRCDPGCDPEEFNRRLAAINAWLSQASSLSVFVDSNNKSNTEISLLNWFTMVWEVQPG